MPRWMYALILLGLGAVVARFLNAPPLVIFALAGWAPEDSDPETDGTDPIGVLVLRRGRVNSLDAGTVFYQLDFAIQQQVRVIS